MHWTQQPCPSHQPGQRELLALSGASSPCPAYRVEGSWFPVALAAQLSAVANY